MKNKFKVGVVALLFSTVLYSGFANATAAPASCDASNTNKCVINGVGTGTGKLSGPTP